jgi:hypothetical protein
MTTEWAPNLNSSFRFIPGREQIVLEHRGPTFGRDGWDGFTISSDSNALVLEDSDLILLEDAAQGGTGYETVADAKRIVSDVREQESSDGAYQAEYLGWRLPCQNVATMPQPGDLVIDGSDRVYVVQDVGDPDFGSCYRLSCKRLVLEDLGHLVQYIQCSATSGSTAARTVTDTAVGDPMPCAIQPKQQAQSDMFGAKTMPELFTIWLYQDPGGDGPDQIKSGDMFQDENGVYYEILQCRDRKRIDALSAFDVIKKL